MNRAAERQSPGAFRGAAQASSLAAAALGCVALISWLIGKPWLSAVLPGRPPMVPNTALGLIVAAVGIDLQVAQPVGRGRRAAGVVCGLVLLALGVATSAEYALGVEGGIDRLLVPGWIASPYPLRPSPPTVLAFILMSAAILVFDVLTRHGHRPAEWLALSTGFVALTTLTGHAYGAGVLYSFARGSVVGVSIPTTLALLLLATGTVLGRPGVGLMRRTTATTPGGGIIRRFGLAAVLIPPVVGLLVEIVEKAGLHDRALTFALLATSMIPITLTIVFVTARFVDRAHHALEESREHERELRVRLEGLGRAAVAVGDEVATLPGAAVNALLQTIVLHGRALTHARYGAFGIGSDPTRAFDTWEFSGVSEREARTIGRFPRPVGLLGGVARGGNAVRLGDMTRAESFGGFPAGHPPMKSFLGVPIRFRGEIVGNLYLADKEDASEFSEEDEQLVQLLAVRAGMALEAARVYRAEASGRTWLQDVIDQMPEAVIVTDASGRVVHVNLAAQVFAHPNGGTATDPLSSPGTLDVRWPSGAPVESDELPLSQALTRKETVTGVELLLRDRDGRLVPVLANASPIQGRGGEDGGAVCLFQDITLPKELERLREEWTSIVAHDLRQPVAVISLAVAGLTPQRIHTVDAPKMVERIQSETRNLSRMIDDLLDASRIESRRLRVDCRRLDLRSWLEEIVERAALMTRGFTVEMRAPDDLPDVYADPSRVEQILMNLLSNAARYGTPGTEIQVAAERGTTDVAVSVTNRGRGVSREEIAHLFTRFYRAPEARTHLQGLGLGLFIVKGLVEAHGGRIDVDSTPDEKTTFRFTLPMYVEPGPGDLSPRGISATRSAAAPAASRRATAAGAYDQDPPMTRHLETGQ